MIARRRLEQVHLTELPLTSKEEEHHGELHRHHLHRGQGGTQMASRANAKCLPATAGYLSTPTITPGFKDKTE
jgi:hypothetical protein